MEKNLKLESPSIFLTGPETTFKELKITHGTKKTYSWCLFMPEIPLNEVTEFSIRQINPNNDGLFFGITNTNEKLDWLLGAYKSDFAFWFNGKWKSDDKSQNCGWKVLESEVVTLKFDWKEGILFIKIGDDDYIEMYKDPSFKEGTYYFAVSTWFPDQSLEVV